MKTKTVFISHLPIPNLNIGSWTNRYSKLIEENTASFDYIIAPKGDNFIDKVNYLFIKEPKFLTFKISNFIKFYKHRVYWSALKNILSKDDDIVVHIVDNPNIFFAINFYSKKHKLNHRIKIVFHMCGYSYDFRDDQSLNFYKGVDTLIVQTKSSIEFQRGLIEEGTCKVVQVYNGIDTTKFYSVNKNEKESLRIQENINLDKRIFLWVSQDRPKKGLSIILEAWELLLKKYDNIQLLIIGAEKKMDIDNITWLGKIQNSKLPRYYQLSDFYLFSTQCNEGFGLTLGEALNSGVTCLASNLEPMGELLLNGEYGRLINNSSNSNSWVEAIIEELDKYSKNNYENIYLKNLKQEIYSYKEWKKNILTIVNSFN